MTISPAAFSRLPASAFSRRWTSGASPSAKTSQRSWQAVATLLTFCPPGPEAARNFSCSASSGISKGIGHRQGDVAEAGAEEARRQRRGRLDRRLVAPRDAERQSVEQHRPPAAPVDGVAGDRDADPVRGVDADL